MEQPDVTSLSPSLKGSGSIKTHVLETLSEQSALAWNAHSMEVPEHFTFVAAPVPPGVHMPNLSFEACWHLPTFILPEQSSTGPPIVESVYTHISMSGTCPDGADSPPTPSGQEPLTSAYMPEIAHKGKRGGRGSEAGVVDSLYALLGNVAGAIRIRVVLDIDAVAIARVLCVLLRFRAHADVELGICERRAIAGGTAASVSRVRAQLNGAESGESESEHFVQKCLIGAVAATRRTHGHGNTVSIPCGRAFSRDTHLAWSLSSHHTSVTPESPDCRCGAPTHPAHSGTGVNGTLVSKRRQAARPGPRLERRERRDTPSAAVLRPW
eukprot:scaffold132514_cov63-Phaeocystis_antarctica.AAC.3